MSFELEERRVDVGELQLGMFVCRLDRPWEETSFPLQGVELKNAEDIAQLRDLCEYVFIDAHRLVPEDRYTRTLRNGNPAESRFERVVDYGIGVAVEDEAERADEAFSSAIGIVEDIVRDISAGRGLSVATVDRAVRPVVESVLRSADAFFWIEAQRSRNAYLYKHSISCSALAAAFGRHMGFAEDTIVSLAAGGLLLDVGKSRVRQELLDRAGPLDAPETVELRAHVEHGVALLEQSDIGDRDVLDMVRSHHERYDGSGYPSALFGNGIPLLARMAAIIDSYDAMISPVPYRRTLSKTQALSRIYAGRDSAYQSELVEQFQACLGVYPTGSLVELSSGELAVVMAQNQARRLRPRVAVVTDREKRPIEQMWIMDLMLQDDGDDEAVMVIRGLKPGDCGLDPEALFL